MSRATSSGAVTDTATDGNPLSSVTSSKGLLDDGERKIVIKAYLNDSEKIQVEVKRSIPFHELHALLKDEYKMGLVPFTIKYKDEEGDLVKLSDRSLEMAVKEFEKNGLKFLELKLYEDELADKNALQDEAAVAEMLEEMDTAGMSKNDRVYLWGDGSYGQLGNGNLNNHIQPVMLEFFKSDDRRCVQIALGSRHAIAVTEDQDVFVWGSGEEGQLGLDCVPKISQVLTVSQNIIPKPKKIPMLDDKQIRQVACSEFATFALSAKGDLFSWGGLTGQPHHSAFLGFGDSTDWRSSKCPTDSLVPRQISIFEGCFVMAVACGISHAIIMLDTGEVYSWGCGHRGRLGHGNNFDMSTPRLVERLKGRRVVQVSVGAGHNAVLTSIREVVTWGEGGSGQLGHGDHDDAWLPKVIKLLQGESIVVVDCGKYHTGALSKYCSLFTWGAGQYGRLGHGDETSTPVPRKVEELERRGIRSMALGGWHTIALADNGDVYSWGHNGFGQLGHGDKRNESSPRLLEILEGKNVRQVAAGEYFSAALTADPPRPPETPATLAHKKKCIIM